MFEVGSGKASNFNKAGVPESHGLSSVLTEIATFEVSNGCYSLLLTNQRRNLLGSVQEPERHSPEMRYLLYEIDKRRRSCGVIRRKLPFRFHSHPPSTTDLELPEPPDCTLPAGIYGRMTSIVSVPEAD